MVSALRVKFLLHFLWYGADSLSGPEPVGPRPSLKWVCTRRPLFSALSHDFWDTSLESQHWVNICPQLLDRHIPAFSDVWSITCPRPKLFCYKLPNWSDLKYRRKRFIQRSQYKKKKESERIDSSVEPAHWRTVHSVCRLPDTSLRRADTPSRAASAVLRLCVPAVLRFRARSEPQQLLRRGTWECESNA